MTRVALSVLIGYIELHKNQNIQNDALFRELSASERMIVRKRNFGDVSFEQMAHEFVTANWRDPLMLLSLISNVQT